MGGFRVSVGGLLGLIAFSGLTLACLRYPAAPWAGILRLAYFAALVTAPMAAAAGRDERRMFWLGFALWGWGYLAYLSIPLATGSGERLATGRLLAAAYPLMTAPAPKTSDLATIETDILMDQDLPSAEVNGRVDIQIRGSDPRLVEGVVVRVLLMRSQRPAPGLLEARAYLTLEKERASDLMPLLQAAGENKQLLLIPRRPGFFERLAAAPQADPDSFNDVGHAAFGLLAGFIGGAVGLGFHARRERTTSGRAA